MTDHTDDVLAPPADLGPSGLALWRDLTDTYDFSPHDLALVLEAARIRDRLEALDAVVRAESVTITTPQGIKAHPALVESRQQGITLTRVLASLRLPDDSGVAPQRRGGARGTYASRRSYGARSLAV